MEGELFQAIHTNRGIRGPADPALGRPILAIERSAYSNRAVRYS